jgi:hypothetical protein
MVQDYTVYTHLAGPLGIPLLGRRVFVALRLPQSPQYGSKAAAVSSPFGQVGRLLESVPCCNTRGMLDAQQQVSAVASLCAPRCSPKACMPQPMGARGAGCLRPPDQVSATDMQGSLWAPRSAAMVQDGSSVIVEICFCHFHRTG